MTIEDGSKEIQLPLTPNDFNELVDALGKYANIDNAMKYCGAVAGLIVRHPHDSWHIKPDSLVTAIRRQQAQEVAWGVLQALKEEEKKKQDAATPLDATIGAKAAHEIPSNGRLQAATK
jgi:hypothetical protein